MSFWQRFVRSEVQLWIVFVVFLGIATGLYFWNRAHPLISYDYNLSITTPEGKKEPLQYGSWPSLSNPDFYASVRSSLVENKVDFIEANLSTMRLKYYVKGEVVKDVTILTKGKKGSWWETPAGLYKVNDKFRKHLSSFSPVYTDWNLPFQGNFFIHGWPVWAESGEPVTSTYSGGCIRLSDADAQAVYQLVSVGTPVLVYEDSSTDIEHDYEANIPVLSSGSYLAADLWNNFVFLKKETLNTSDFTPFSPLLTALVATDYMDIERNIYSQGKTYTLYDLLFPLLLKSSSSTARDILAPLGTTRAQSLMADKIKSIGMSTTKGGLTTVEDIFHLASYLYNYRSFILDFTNKKINTAVYGSSPFSSIPNSNPLKDYPSYKGGILGKNSDGTESGVAIFEIPFNSQIRPIAIVVTDSNNAVLDITSILDYLEKSYK
ncbi:L,D-transpeptidase [Candidatus Parcubacteria bacterium]|nr:L,D-transpeptidase [Candidatus Parcubacteria bacterium]